MTVKYMNLNRNKFKHYKKDIKKIFKNGIFILGKEVQKFENNISKICKVPYVVGVSSGSDALVLALKVYNIGYMDEVIVPNISYIATANSVKWVGSNVKFCDVDNEFNLDAQKLEKLITVKTKAIIIVHYGGSIGNIKKIQQIASKYNILLIEDAAQAFLAKKGKEFAGTLADIGCFSLNPMKNFGAFGEAGMILTKDKDIYEKLIMLRNNGVDINKNIQTIGTNAKIDTLQAVLLNKKLKFIHKNIKKRQQIVKRYNSAFKNFVKVPKFSKNNIYFTYTILTNQKNELLKFLNKNNIEAKVYHTAMSLEKPYRSLHHNDLNNSIKLSNQKLALPCNEFMTDNEVEYIISKVKDFFVFKR